MLGQHRGRVLGGQSASRTRPSTGGLLAQRGRSAARWAVLVPGDDQRAVLRADQRGDLPEPVIAAGTGRSRPERMVNSAQQLGCLGDSPQWWALRHDTAALLRVRARWERIPSTEYRTAVEFVTSVYSSMNYSHSLRIPGEELLRRGNRNRRYVPMEARRTDEVRVRLRRGQQGPEGPARRQGRQPRRDGRTRAAGARRASPSPPRPAGRTWPRARTPAGLAEEIDAHLAALERTMGRTLGDPADPLLVSVRSGAKFSMPGMMETVLNVGLNDASPSPGWPPGQRQRAVRLGLLPPADPDVRQDRL